MTVAVLLVNLGLHLGQSQIALADAPEEGTAKQIAAAQPADASELRMILERTLEFNVKNRSLSSNRNGAWQVIHGAVAYGEELPIEVDGKQVLAIDYLLNGGTLNGWQLKLGSSLPQTNRPGIIADVESGSFIGQGHTDQWLGYFSQIALSLDRTVIAEGEKLSLLDWARQAQFDVPTNPYQEYSWTLIALTNFFPNESSWVANDGKTWTLEPLVRFEAQQDLADSACGGMHRLMGLAHAVRYRQNQNELLNEGWGMAKKVVDVAILSARRFQSSDGSFSTNYTERPGTSADLSLVISATGHTLEFLSFALPKAELEKPWMERAALRLCSMLKASESIDLECGGAYHALAGLKLYHKRRYLVQ